MDHYKECLLSSIRIGALMLISGCGPGSGASEGENCPPGTEDCPCLEHFECDDGLLCVGDLCVEDIQGEGGEGEEGGAPEAEPDEPTPLTSIDADILFVVDNSSSMLDFQRELARTIGSFVEQLEKDDLNYRIGVTTTDHGSTFCGQTEPESGRFVSTSCLDRLNDFAIGGNGSPIPEACTDSCSYSADELALIGTTTSLDPTLTPRPWIERIDGVSNLADNSISSPDALQCILPQGISGCTTEEPLKAMESAIEHSFDPASSMYGFIRPGGLLTVIFVTDEADCSVQNDPPSMGNTQCWNYGVACPDFDNLPSASCHALDYEVSVVENETTIEQVMAFYGVSSPEELFEIFDVDTEEEVIEIWNASSANDAYVPVPTTDPSSAVLYPVSRYVDFLKDLQERENGPGMVSIGLLVGVDQSGEVHYTNVDHDPDPLPFSSAFQGKFGVGPGCYYSPTDWPQSPWK